MIEVTLTELECNIARFVSQQRQDGADAAGRRNAHGATGGVNLHDQGAAAEIAYAKAMNVFPTGIGLTFEEDDDVGGVQVRGRTEHWHELYLWLDDDPDVPWVLVTGTMPTFRIQGWTFGSWAMTKEYFAPAFSKGNFPREDSYIVPTVQLRPINDLRKFLHDSE